MKGIAIALLSIIAIGVGYLAYSEYQRRQALADFAHRVSDPDGWLAKEWAERAKLKCDGFYDVETVTAASGQIRPMAFTCYSERTGFWTVTERFCDDSEWIDRTTAIYPNESNLVFQPMAVLCWDLETK